jgi:hypothetical protein
VKIINDANLPEPLFNAIQYSDRDRGESDYTVTELIEPPRIGALKLRHKDEIVENASDRIWALIGSVGHEILARGSKGQIVEKRLFAELDGYKISGQCDLLEEGIVDYKFTSVWAVKKGLRPEWEQQLNCYAWLAHRNSIPVPSLKIIAILRDWNINEAKRNPDMPQSQVVVFPVQMWGTGVVEDWMRIRIALHENAREGVLPECSAAEMWEHPEKYAVMKRGNVKASRVLDTKLEAGQWMASQPKPQDFTIEVRLGERPRCQSYCSVSEFCSVYKQWKGQNEIKS